MRMTISEEKAKEKAERNLRFTLGTLPFLSEPTETDEGFEFKILYTHSTFEEGETSPVYYEPRQIGSLRVSYSGDVSRTNRDLIKENISKVISKCNSGKVDIRSN